jgi:hypothetical protein
MTLPPFSLISTTFPRLWSSTFMAISTDIMIDLSQAAQQSGFIKLMGGLDST